MLGLSAALVGGTAPDPTTTPAPTDDPLLRQDQTEAQSRGVTEDDAAAPDSGVAEDDDPRAPATGVAQDFDPTLPRGSVGMSGEPHEGDVLDVTRKELDGLPEWRRGDEGWTRN